ncbi:MAG: hypothetical protein R3F65_10205 [bacterium]
MRDGVDDDCDGRVDEGAGVGAACAAGWGVPARRAGGSGGWHAAV